MTKCGLDEQEASSFRYSYSVYQVEYSRNLLFRLGGQMDRVFDTVVDRTRSQGHHKVGEHPVSPALTRGYWRCAWFPW